MYWSHHEPAWYERTLDALGLEQLGREVLGHGYEEQDGSRPAEQHPVLHARKPR